MSQVAWQTIKDFHDAPGTCGVYQYWAGDTLLYIGKAINLKVRLSSHAQNAKLDAKEAAIVAGDTIKYTLCDTEFKALILESKLIRTLKPPHNRAWKDDKTYLYIVIDLKDPFPRPRFARGHDIDPTLHSTLSTKHLYIFGPFPNSKIAEEVLRAIRRLIPFCMTKRVTTHPCFYSRIGLCNPCPSNIQKLTNPDRDIKRRQYRLQIRQVVKILEGNVDPVIKDLMLKMKIASTEQDFETALSIHKGIERFKRFITTHSFTDRHFSYNDSSSKLASLMSILSANSYHLISLHRIECYDASNSLQYDSTVSMTVMTEGLLDHGQYRRFKIKNPNTKSDFDRLDEAMERRLKNTTWPKPDLLLIDGGVPQLRRLQRIIDKQGMPLNYLGLAKHPDRLIISQGDGFTTVKLPFDHLALQLLQQLRDESHRFANQYRKVLERNRTKI